MPEFGAKIQSELSFLERFMPEYSGLLSKVSAVIRDRVWPLSDELFLATFLADLNKLMGTVVGMMGQDVHLLKVYVLFLCELSDVYLGRRGAELHALEAFSEVEGEIDAIIHEENMAELAGHANPCFIAALPPGEEEDTFYYYELMKTSNIFNAFYDMMASGALPDDAEIAKSIERALAENDDARRMFFGFQPVLTKYSAVCLQTGQMKPSGKWLSSNT